MRIRQAGRIVSVAATVAAGVTRGGRREVPGMATGAGEAETFRTDFLPSLARRGLRGVTLVIADAHERLNAAVRRVLHATSRRCRVHVTRYALAHAGKGHRRLVPAWIGTAFTEADAEGAKRRWRTVADRLRPRVAKLAALLNAAEEDVLAFMAFRKEHRARIHSTDPPERVTGEIERRTDVVGIFPTEGAVARLLGAILLEQNDERAVQHRYMSLETHRARQRCSRHQPARRGTQIRVGQITRVAQARRLCCRRVARVRIAPFGQGVVTWSKQDATR